MKSFNSGGIDTLRPHAAEICKYAQIIGHLDVRNVAFMRDYIRQWYRRI